jgi:hypothetical protein
MVLSQIYNAILLTCMIERKRTGRTDDMVCIEIGAPQIIYLTRICKSISHQTYFMTVDISNHPPPPSELRSLLAQSA